MRKSKRGVIGTAILPSEGDRRHTVRVSDPDYPGLVIDFGFQRRGGSALLEDGEWRDLLELISVCIRADESADEIRAYDLRAGFPWATWAECARGRAADDILGEEGMIVSEDDEVLSGSPLALFAIAEEYRRNVGLGLRGPVAQIARQHRVKPATARNWIRRARQLGFLPPAEVPARGKSKQPARSRSSTARLET